MLHNTECTGPFQTSRTLILASASPRRRELLAAAGVKFSVEPSRAQEPPAEKGQEPLGYASENARIKAMEVASRFPDAAVIGADTIVVLEDKILGKPSGPGQAVEMLSSLCGREHTVITACCLAVINGSRMFHAQTRVWLAAQDRAVVEAYVAGGEPLDKAGSYAVQGCGAFMVSRLEGSYTNVVGFPMEMVIPVLLQEGVISVRK